MSVFFIRFVGVYCNPEKWFFVWKVDGFASRNRTAPRCWKCNKNELGKTRSNTKWCKKDYLYLAMVHYSRPTHGHSLLFQNVAKFLDLHHGLCDMFTRKWLAAMLLIKRPIFLMSISFYFNGEWRNIGILWSANNHLLQWIPFIISTHWTVRKFLSIAVYTIELCENRIQCGVTTV